MRNGRGSRIRRFTMLIAVLALLAGSGVPADAVVVYSNDFQGGVTTDWISSGNPIQIQSTPLPGDGSRKFLGQFGNDTVSLTLGTLPPHTWRTVTFDLYVIRTWDGANSSNSQIGPDVFDLSLGSGENLIHTTFSNITWVGGDPLYDQNYPNGYPGATNPPRTGASEMHTLGYIWATNIGIDSVYHLSFSGPHSASSVVFNFTGSGLQVLDDESWGLDNVRVEVVPVPGTLLLLGSGLLGLAGFRWRGRS